MVHVHEPIVGYYRLPFFYYAARCIEAYLCISIGFSIMLVSLVFFLSLTIIFFLYTAMAGVPYWAEEGDEKKEGLGVSGCWVAAAFRYLHHGTSLYRGGKYVLLPQLHPPLCVCIYSTDRKP